LSRFRHEPASPYCLIGPSQAQKLARGAAGRAPEKQNKKIFAHFPKQSQDLHDSLRARPTRRATGQDM
jgi:hypothetical protein